MRWNAGSGTFGTSPSFSTGSQRMMLVKKIVLTLVAASTLGLAACGDDRGAANNMAGNESEVTNQADGDVGTASDNQNAANDALNSAANFGSDVGNAASDAARAAGN